MNHEKFYSKAFFYDLAFRFKDVEKENQTIIDLYRHINDKMPSSFLDIAAGPAANAIEMNTRKIKSFAIDQSKEMVAYGNAKAKDGGLEITYLLADMTNFKLAESIDLAAIFMASTGYILTNEDMVKHLNTVSDNLKPKGIYVMEMLHPRDIFSTEKSTATDWEESDGVNKVFVQWGDQNDTYDPITETRKVTVHLKYQTADESGEIIDQCLQREYTFQEMKALIALSGTFELRKVLGSWDLSVPFSNDTSAWRMILVLQKR